MGRLCRHEGHWDGLRLGEWWGVADDEQQSARAGGFQVVFDQLRERLSDETSRALSSSFDAIAIAIRGVGVNTTPFDSGTTASWRNILKSSSSPRTTTTTPFQSND
jgi:hypothetical protein